ncbi:hypothetical protein [Ramlibacter albus]|uniref:Uncharacterized protein n=1 Tax=Ramlibacter albus TaxID=2079448 RepID=A0A923S6Q4_9BURK|nr:hypothetical protein [Ramlibacter albus]MBC5766387.1 hypothetical protein [Ramlibacter albus]
MDARLASLVLALPLACGCGGGGGGGSPASPTASTPTAPATTTTTTTTPAAAATAGTAFFYQDVGIGGNSVRAGITTDGRNITSYNSSVLRWTLPSATGVYADAVFSRLSNGRWVMAAATTLTDPRGALALQIHESSCPAVTDANVKVLGRSSASGCENAGALAMGKHSQVFEVNGSRYMFGMTNSRVILMRLTDATRGIANLSSICVRRTAATTLSELAWGEATTVLDSARAPGLFLSDTAIARRTDGTWVLFVKGIASNNGCTEASLCELCARGIYRSTSTDLINWSTPERVVSQASVPDAYTAPDGRVWLYWQDFGPACTAQNVQLAGRAPIRGAPESDFTASAPVSIPGEAFEANTNLHYPTNGNPVLLPDAAATAAFNACFGR